jgi:hypothetical protein
VADIIHKEIPEAAQALHDSGDVSGAYAVLGRAGDKYADKAWAITNDQRGSFFDAVVYLTWTVQAPELMEKKFNAVAAAHQQNYLDIIARQRLVVDGATFYQLPDSFQIEESYCNAIIDNDVPPFTATDLLLNYYTGGIISWSLPLGLEDSRRSSQMFTVPEFEDHCFLAGTQVSMWDGTKKPIEQVEVGDIVVSYDKDGTLKPGRVSRTMTNHARQILDVHGLMVTPGHATLCGDGRFDGKHVPILDILRSDGALVLEDGSKIRAGTGCGLSTRGDRMITAIIGEQQADGLVRIAEVGQIRAGTRFIHEDGEDVSVLDMILRSGGRLTEDGMIQTSADGPKMPFRWTFTSSLPKPEDYVLQRSATRLHEIYQANEWESVRPSMPPPMGGEAGMTISKHPAIVAAAPMNMPLALRSGPDTLQMSRKYRRAVEASARKKKTVMH